MKQLEHRKAIENPQRNKKVMWGLQIHMSTLTQLKDWHPTYLVPDTIKKGEKRAANLGSIARY